MYRRNGSSFTYETALETSEVETDLIGGLALSGGRIAVSGRYFCFDEASSCTGSSVVRVYARTTDEQWQLQGAASIPAELATVPVTQPILFGGHGLVFENGLLVVSSTYEGSGTTGLVPADRRPSGSNPVRLGTVYVFEEVEHDWRLAARLGPPTPSGDESPLKGFGRGLALNGPHFAVASTDDGRGPTNDATDPVARGAVTIYGIDCSLVPAGAPVPGC